METHVLERQIPTMPGQAPGPKRTVDRRFSVEHLIDSIAGRGRALQAVKDVRELARRIGRSDQQAVKQQELAPTQRSIRHPNPEQMGFSIEH
jgi:hypothetical protein